MSFLRSATTLLCVYTKLLRITSYFNVKWNGGVFSGTAVKTIAKRTNTYAQYFHTLQGIPYQARTHTRRLHVHTPWQSLRDSRFWLACINHMTKWPCKQRRIHLDVVVAECCWATMSIESIHQRFNTSLKCRRRLACVCDRSLGGQTANEC